MSSTDEEYILRWNDHGVSFFNLAEDLLSQDLLTDVTGKNNVYSEIHE